MEQPTIRRLALLLCLSLAAAARPAAAQEAARALSLCDKPTLSLPEAAWLALGSASLLPEGAGPAEALAKLRELGWIGRASREDVQSFPTTVGEFAFLAMKARGLRGGIAYALFPGPRYAFRELAYLGALPPAAESGQAIGGTLALRTLSKLDELKGAGR